MWVIGILLSAAVTHVLSKNGLNEMAENLVKLEQMSIQNVTKEQEEILKRSKIPPAYWPYVNITEVERQERKRNATDGGVITDEDVADVPDDDEHPKPNTMHFDGKKTIITITEDAETKLYQHWTDQAVSGLMAAHATLKMKNVGYAEKLAHKQCNKDVKTVEQHAKCVLALLEAEQRYQQWLKKHGEKTKNVGRLNSLKKTFREHGSPRTHQGNLSTGHGWLGSFRMRAKRSAKGPQLMTVKPITRNAYNLIDEGRESPLGIIAKNLLRDIRKMKNKKDKDFKEWNQVISELREEGKKMKKEQKARRLVEKRLNMFLKALRKEKPNSDSTKSIQSLNLFTGEDSEVKMDELMMKAKEQEQKVTTEDKLMKAPMELVRRAMKIGMMMSGQDVSDFDKKNLDIISPRFLPIVPEEDSDNDTLKFISPSLFALHDEGHGIENETSLARAMTMFGKKDNKALLDFIIEAAGVSDTLDNMKERVSTGRSRQKDSSLYSPEGQPLFFTKENVTEMFGMRERNKVETFERLLKTLTEEQMTQMNSTGYTVMNQKQLDTIYGPSSPYHDPETHVKLSNTSFADVPAAIDRTVRGIAAETMKFKVQRRKQIVLSPLLFAPVILNPATASQPIILSPLLFDPIILSPAVFGAVILSPFLFAPIVLAPRVLSPVILSPHLFAPIILSPLALSPNILNSGVLNPIILSPLVLSPFILHPVALTPLILSPFALNPFIVVPHTLSPLILSPFFLSPVIYSPPYYSAFVLSPHALSPSIESKGYCFISILSPSWLS